MNIVELSAETIAHNIHIVQIIFARVACREVWEFIQVCMDLLAIIAK